MFIENPDAFKSWLTSVLEPLCDADPEALAKYVFALVKKEKPLEELRECMIEQLDVFLQSETKPFVELLFKTLENQEYLNNCHAIPNTNPPNPNVVPNPVPIKREPGSPKQPEPLVVVKDIKPIIPVSTLPNLSESINGAVKPKVEEPPMVVPTATISSTTKRDHRKSDSEKDEPAAVRGRGTRLRHRSSSRNRSRSRSWDRSAAKRSRSRDRSPRIERRDRSRPWRNKSPPRRYDRDRRRSRSGSPIGGGRMRSRSRSPRHSYRIGGRYRNRSPPRSISRSRSRSNERSNRLDKDKDKNKDVKHLEKDPKDDNNSGGATPTQDSNHGDTDMRLTNTTQSIQSVVSALNPPNVPGIGDAFIAPGKRRCRDFDEKGYCMRGEMCPYDHGVDPVVLEDTALSRVLTFGPNGAPQVVPDGSAPPPTTAGPPGGLMNPVGMLGMPPGFHQRASLIHASEYNPSAPGMWHHRPGFRPRGPPGPLIRGGPMPPNNNVGPFGPMQSIQRELISVPVTDNMQGPNVPGIIGGGNNSCYKRRSDYNNHSPDMGGQQPPMKKRQGGFDFNRLGPRTGPLGPMIKNPANCSLELKKVPRGLNNITHLNNHFSKFGKIVNIQVCFEGDPEGAIVTFSSHAEANAAYRSTEAVLNNRFIKVFWHSAGGGENIPPPLMQTNNGQRASVTLKERLGQSINSNKVLNLVQPKATEPRITAAAAAAAAAPGGDDGPNETDDDNNKNANNKLSTNVYVPSSVKKDATTVLQQQQQQKEDSKALANAAIVKNQEILAAKEQLKKKHEEKRKEAIKITQDLRKRKQELLEKQLAQQKLLIEKLEKTNPTGQQRELLMSTIKTVQESIESIRKDMVSQTIVANAAVKPAPGILPRKSKEEAQREVLDAELDLITRQQEGGDTTELQRRLLDLRAQAYNLTRGGGGGGAGPLGAGASRRGRGAQRARHHLHHSLHHHLHHHHHNLTKNNMVLDNTKRSTGMGNLTSSAVAAAAAISTTTTTAATAMANKKPHTVIDHRPTRLLVSGYEGDESESVLAHFSQYGEITEYVADDSTPSIILTYRTRKESEIAVLKGKHFQDRTLSVTWCTDAQLNTVQRGANSRTVLLSVSSPNNTATNNNNNNNNHNNQQKIDIIEQPQPSEVEGPEENTATGIVSADIKQTEKLPIDVVVAAPEDEDEDEEESGVNNIEDQLLEGDDENVSGEQHGTELSEEALLQDDEEDLDEDEERSWRR